MAHLDIHNGIFGPTITKETKKRLRLAQNRGFHFVAYLSFTKCLKEVINVLYGTNLGLSNCSIDSEPIFLDRQKMSVLLVFGSNFTIIETKTGNETLYECNSDSVVYIQPSFWNEYELGQLTDSQILYYDTNVPLLEHVYTTPTARENLAIFSKAFFRNITDMPVGKQCVQHLLVKSRLLGTGCYGNVYKIPIDDIHVALKLSKTRDDAMKEPFGTHNSSWNEINILKTFNVNKCPNIPVLSSYFACSKSKIILDEEETEQESAITVVEIASGDLRNFFKKNPPVELIWSALFQILVALHYIQMNGQIMHFDIKMENVLYYVVKPGGYWKYTINKMDYVLPNLGYIFILNDFGLSRPMSPKLKLYRNAEEEIFRLGSRYGIVMNGVFTPLVSKFGNQIKWETLGEPRETLGEHFLMNKDGSIEKSDVVFTPSQESFLESLNIPRNTQDPEFFNHPNVIPPFEFYNDLQDVLRMFTGGKRTTQRGNHKLYPCIPKEMVLALEPHSNASENTKAGVFNTRPSQILAGYCIKELFGKMFRPKREKDILAHYQVD